MPISNEQLQSMQEAWDNDPSLREHFSTFEDFVNQAGGGGDSPNAGTTGTGTTGTGTSTTSTNPLDLSSLISSPSWTTRAPGALDSGVYNAQTDTSKQNTNSVQGSSQGGAFASQGSTNTNQATSQTQTQDQTQTSNTNTTQSGINTGANQQNTLNTTSNQTVDLGHTNQSSVNSTNGTSASVGQQATTNNQLSNTAQNNASNQSTASNQNTATNQNNFANQSTASNQQSASNTIGQENTSGLSNTATTNTGLTSQTDQGKSQSVENGKQIGETSGLSSTNVTDSLGLGSLISQQAKAAQTSDAARNTWLTDVMQNGGTGYQDQMQQAINNSLSGPGMQGVGNMAKGRVAGSAAEQIAMNNMDQRLAAAQQLQSGGQFAQVAALGNPYLGSSTATSGTSATNTANTTQNSTQNTSDIFNQNTGNSSTANSGTSQSVGSTQGNVSNVGNTASNGGSTSIGNTSTNENTASNGYTNASNATSSTGLTNSSNSSANVSNTAGNTSTDTANSGAQSNISAGSTSGTNVSTANNTSSSDTLNTLKSAANSIGLSSLISNESQKGTSAANSMQVATGQIPQSTQSGGGGGCYVCTAYVSQGKMRREAVREAAQYKLNHMDEYGTSLHGYSIYGPWLARQVYKNGWFAKTFYPIAKAVLDHELTLAGWGQPKLFPFLAHAVFHYGSIPFSWGARLFGRREIVTPNPDFELLKEQNLEFNFNYKV